MKRKFTNKVVKDKSQSPDKKKMIETVEEFMVRVTDLENTNKTLLAQLQIAREKLRVRESENAILRNKTADFEKVKEECR